MPKKKKTLKQIADLYHAFKNVIIHADNVLSWHNQDIEHKDEKYYYSASCGGIAHLKKTSTLPLLMIEKNMSIKKVKK